MTPEQIMILLKIAMDVMTILEEHGVSRENIDKAIDAEKQRKEILIGLLKKG